ncbi:MAG TPA: hypothetical protein P5257_00660 [Bacteroidales bacterium]|nr:hypothetical protein [Bacteroidales bacterium]HRR92405.1 hypothetical protein [Bacteroidales bacterium]HRT88604.1 hypothetical protein [Bacteroidales bacterium]
MKKGLTIIIGLFFSWGLLNAQNQAMERLNAYKVAFFTKRLNLTTQEAQRFWPVYNELQDMKLAVQQERAKIFREINQNELNMSEKELISAGDRLIELDLKEAELNASYHKKFREVLSPLKVVRLYQAENQYRLQLLNELRENAPVRNNIQQQRQLRNN